ncbi:hypothetical protein [Oleisolibacter albus]|uniref:hypothetical protein n=1 Tax=Oleisolibacter albus TaxID=2171757 RepID=UPI000DF110F3|nr:hypothetical protein [Oleisolibacter albus]
MTGKALPPDAGPKRPARQLTLAERVARLAWFDCADGATRRDLAHQSARPQSQGAPTGEARPFSVRKPRPLR